MRGPWRRSDDRGKPPGVARSLPVSEFIVISPPALEPLSLADAKLHLKVDTTADDALIESLIRACRFHIERLYDIALITQTLQLNLDYFPYWWLWRGSSSNYQAWWL